MTDKQKADKHRADVEALAAASATPVGGSFVRLKDGTLVADRNGVTTKPYVHDSAAHQAAMRALSAAPEPAASAASAAPVAAEAPAEATVVSTTTDVSPPKKR